MRLLKLLFLLPIFANAQEAEVVFSMPEYQKLYRGWPHKVNFGTIDGTTEYDVIAEGGAVNSNENGYTLTPQNDKLKVIFLKKGIKDTINVIDYNVIDLPSPELYFGHAGNNQFADKYCNRLFVKYGDGGPLPVKFSVLNWEMEFKGKVVKGSGNKLDSYASELLSAANPGSKVTFIVTYKGPDGVSKSISSSVNF
jgi:hypothetical protein